MTKIKNDKIEKASTNDLILEQLEKLNKEVKEIKSDNEHCLSYLGFLNEYIKSDKFLLVIIIVLLLYHIVIGG